MVFLSHFSSSANARLKRFFKFSNISFPVFPRDKRMPAHSCMNSSCKSFVISGL
ncbi:hypothetical protein EVA_03340 [gut metagenome]|uniref:Uncharacterized protein n=1 Tax=gut metagenome TaxID=749906 RepID=J9H489_9ZZZZ